MNQLKRDQAQIDVDSDEIKKYKQDTLNMRMQLASLSTKAMVHMYIYIRRCGHLYVCIIRAFCICAQIFLFSLEYAKMQKDVVSTQSDFPTILLLILTRVFKTGGISLVN